MENGKKYQFLNALDLKLLAMVLMFCDHLWATLLPSQQWLTNLGRLAYPIFAFQIVEGYFHTHDVKKYLKRLFLFAILSEIPFNLMTAGGLLNPFQQNVLFTFCLGILLFRFLDRMKAKSTAAWAVSVPFAVVGGYLLGMVTFVDYYGYGILMLLAFYLFRNVKHGWLGLILSMILINGEFMGGLTYELSFFGRTFCLYQQSLAVLALIPISLYNGKQGPHNKALQYVFYAFYPAHMLILALIWLSVV